MTGNMSFTWWLQFVEIPLFLLIAAALWKFSASLAAHKLYAAEKYATKDQLHDVETKVLDELKAIRARLDRLIEVRVP